MAKWAPAHRERPAAGGFTGSQTSCTHSAPFRGAWFLHHQKNEQRDQTPATATASLWPSFSPGTRSQGWALDPPRRTQSHQRRSVTADAPGRSVSTQAVRPHRFPIFRVYGNVIYWTTAEPASPPASRSRPGFLPFPTSPIASFRATDTAPHAASTSKTTSVCCLPRNYQLPLSQTLGSTRGGGTRGTQGRESSKLPFIWMQQGSRMFSTPNA